MEQCKHQGRYDGCLECARHSCVDYMPVVDAAWQVSAFAKSHEYPELGSPEFIRFSELINKLEIELKKLGYKVIAL